MRRVLFVSFKKLRLILFISINKRIIRNGYIWDKSRLKVLCSGFNIIEKSTLHLSV